MNPTPVVAEAVAKLNEQRTEQVQIEAVRLINCISNEQNKIAECEKRISDLRVEANKLAKTVVDETSVLGSPLPANANRETIAKVIEKANRDKQGGIEIAANRLTNAIVYDQEAIVAIEKRIKELREALLKLTVPTVSVEQIVG